MVTDGRYTAQAAQEVKGAEVRIAKGPALAEACRWLAAARVKHAYYDGEQTTVASLGAMEESLKGSGLKRSGRRDVKRFFQPLESPLVAAERMVKDAAEIERMAAAAALGVRLFEHILGFMRPGITENAVAAELEYRARLWGAEAMSFPTIVASGPRSALPHGTASKAKLPRRGFVTLDFGVILNGYCSDMTRTVHLGRGGAREREAYDAVLAAQENAVAAVAAGVKAGDVDEAARSVLREAKLADYFTHSTGHGVGLEIHESPRIAMAQQTLLTKGMVITIEPGVYIPGAFGLRIEDTVVVERRGCRVLTPATKAWIEL
jgi:Xaa-Pro aminopeptidase